MAAAVTLAAKSARMDKVVFDEQSAARIAAAVKWVEQFSLDETTDVASSAGPVIRGQFSGKWDIGTDVAVAFIDSDGNSGSQTAHNYFATVGAQDETNNCCIIQAGSEWILVAAQCEEIPPLESEVD